MSRVTKLLINIAKLASELRRKTRTMGYIIHRYSVFVVVTGFVLISMVSLIHCHRDTYALPRLSLPQRYNSPDAMSRRIDTHGCQSYGTTPYIEEIFVGRCWDYQYVYNDESCMVRDVKNCSELWQLFRSGFAYRDPCNVTGDLYKDFAEAAMHDVGVDKTMFWSGTYFAAHAYSALSQRLTTLEDTLTGYVAQQLIWCGQTDDPGINYMSCNERCYRSAEEAFWGVASTAFARQAKGEVFTLLNGSRPEGAFKNDSYFAKYELPNLDQGQVTMINIVVIHSLDTPATETCDTGSILDLKEIITQYGFRYTCTDDPNALRFLLCAGTPESRSCVKWINHSDSNNDIAFNGSNSYLPTFLLIAALFICHVDIITSSVCMCTNGQVV